MDQRNFAIGVLSTTAAVMLVGLLVLTGRPESAQAAGMSDRGGDYVMSVGTTPQTDEEYLFVLSNSQQKMVVYRFDTNRGMLDMVQGVDLSALRDPPPGRQP